MKVSTLSTRLAFSLVMQSWIRLELFLKKVPLLDYHAIPGMHFGGTPGVHLHLYGPPSSNHHTHQN
jgi:hypothetical protein